LWVFSHIVLLYGFCLRRNINTILEGNYFLLLRSPKFYSTKKLRMRNIRQLRERITHSFYLGAFAAAETRDYLRFRLHAAGCTRPGVFSDGAERLIAKASAGL
jgi:type II secretory pathway predicted ATPase ExeA